MFAMTAASLNSLAVPMLALTVYLALACHCEGEKFAQRIFLPAAISCTTISAALLLPQQATALCLFSLDPLCLNKSGVIEHSPAARGP